MVSSKYIKRPANMLGGLLEIRYTNMVLSDETLLTTESLAVRDEDVWDGVAMEPKSCASQLVFVKK
jgi:hypothetical protein